MSEKEERLYIVRYPSRLIPEATGITVTRKKFNSKSFTRAEAIKKMAEAMEPPYFNDVHASEPDMLEALAAAALDALITEVK